MTRPAFRLDSRDRKLIGVCAGIGRAFNIDPTFVRVGFVAVPLLTFVTFWQALLAYLVIGLVGAVATGKLRRRSHDHARISGERRTSVHDLRTKLGASDRQMMAIDHHLNNSQSDALAREIEALRSEKA